MNYSENNNDSKKGLSNENKPRYRNRRKNTNSSTKLNTNTNTNPKPVELVSFKPKNNFSEHSANKNRQNSNNLNNNRLTNNRSRRNNNKRRNFITRITIKENCPICEKEITDIAFSLSMKVGREDKPVHFDCILNKLKNENTLTNTEKIIYKGVGKFIIVDTSTRGDNLAFKIINEIDFEEFEERPEWRKKVLEQVNKGFSFY